MSNVQTEVPTDPSERVYISLGIVCAVASVYYQPLVFGPLTIYFGLRLYRLDSTPTGVAVALLGVLGMGLGFLYPV